MKQYLQYHLWKYLAVLLIPVILWTSVFQSLKKPAPHQRLHILYIGDSLDTSAMEQQLADALPNLKQLKEITVNTERPELTSLDLLLTARVFDYDIIILQQSYLQNNIGKTHFSPLPESLTVQFAHTYQEDEIAYALTFSPGDQTHFSAFYTGQENCFLFISPESVNFDQENGVALLAVSYLSEIVL